MNQGSGKGVDESSEQGKTVTGPMGIIFSPEPAVWSEARRLVADKKIRVESLAVCASQDPVIVIELLRTANAMFFSGGRSPITSTQTAIVRLGSELVLDLLEKMKERAPIADKDVAFWFEMHRNKGKRCSIVARILAEALAKTMADDCQAVGLLSCVGDLLAVAHFKRDYVRLAEDNSRSSLVYRLAQDHKFDLEKMGLNYLRRQGIPEALYFALHREGHSRVKERAILKPIAMAAIELVEAFDSNRWEKLAPGKSLAPKSAVRMLQIPDSQYLKIYERASEYLVAERAQEEKKRRPAALEVEPVIEAASIPEQDPRQAEIASQIHDLLSNPSTPEQQVAAPTPAPKESPPTAIKTISVSMPEIREAYGIKGPDDAPRTVARIEKAIEPVPPPTLPTKRSSKVAETLSGIFERAQSSEAIISDILQILIDQGPFEKSALIVVSNDRKSAIVVAARGPSLGTGQRITITDPLSPIAQCFSKVQSFGNKQSECSPFGSKSFAVAPLDADHETPVALYADCGNEGSLSFEARRIFRNVVDILNARLPSIPGGIPVELE